MRMVPTADSTASIRDSCSWPQTIRSIQSGDHAGRMYLLIIYYRLYYADIIADITRHSPLMDSVLRAAEKVSVLVQREDVEPVRFVAVVAAAFALFLALLAFALSSSSSSLSRSESSPLAVLHRQAAHTIVNVRTHERDLLRSPHPAPSEPN